jgi:hypothetical protein
MKDFEMTKFNKAGFNFDGMYLMYEGNFIARFKRGGMGDFKRFLVKNFSVEEYLKLVNEFNMAPITALGTKGYVSPNVRKAMKMGLI